MDDGSSQWSKNNKRLYRHVPHARLFSDQKILVLALKRNFNLNVNIIKIEPIVYVCADSITHFQDLIRAYVHDDFFI
jgi:hypothetical protein